jgi:hypothetical protein
VVETPRGLRLWSVLHDVAWEPRRPFVAACGNSHGVPDADCECGVYAVHSPSVAARYLTGRNDPCVIGRVLGVAALWGLVLEGTAGWRASSAYPLRLWVPDGVRAEEMASALAAYGVPIERQPLELADMA